MKIYPIKFKPVFKKRVWGGSVLAGKYKKPFPLDIKIQTHLSGDGIRHLRGDNRSIHGS